MTRKEFVTRATESLSGQYSPGEAKAISIRILSHFLGLSEYEYSVEPNVIIPRPDLVRIQEALDELAADRPVQYVIGEESFEGHVFKVNESVLIPRPETAQLCRLAAAALRSSGEVREPRILDAGTGSGCIAWTLAAAFPKATVLAFDMSAAALETARNQKVWLDEAGRQPVPEPPVFFRADILEGPPGEKDGADLPNLEELDLLISNPPYVCESEKDFMAPNVLDYEPDEALFVPDSDPLRFYRALAGWAETLVRMGGQCFFEINEAFGPQVRELFESRGFSDVEILQDFHGKDRFVTFTKWYAAALLILCSSFRPASAQQKDTVTVMLQWLPQCQFAGMIMAYWNGFYEEAGLEVELYYGTESYSSTDALKDGSADIITTMLVDALIVRDMGTPIVNILQTSETNSTMIISHTPVRQAKDLNGMRIGRWTSGFFDTALCYTYYNSLNVEWIPFLSNIYPFAAGAVDAMVATEYNEYYQIQMAGIDVSEDNIIYLRDEGFDIPEDGVYTTEEYYSSHRDIVERFVGATRRGWDWVRRPENFLETVNTIVDIMREDNIPSSVTNQTYMLRTVLKLQQDRSGKEVPFHLDKSRFDSAVRMLLENNLILSPVEYSDFVRP